jgi:hypothetical protein
MQQQIIHNMHSDQIEYNRVAHAAHRDQQHNKQSLFSHISKLRGSQRLLTSIAGPHIPPATSKDSGASGTNNSSRCFDSATTERRVNKDACERRKAAMTADSWPRPPSMRTYIHTHIHTQSLYLSHSLIFSLSLSLSLSLSHAHAHSLTHTHTTSGSSASKCLALSASSSHFLKDTPRFPCPCLLSAAKFFTPSPPPSPPPQPSPSSSPPPPQLMEEAAGAHGATGVEKRRTIASASAA